MKILHILNDVKKIGNGIVNVAVDLACLQAENGARVAVVSAGGEYEELLESYGVKHLNLNQSRNPINLIKTSFSYQQIVRDFQPEIVHAHMMTGVILARLFKHKFHYTLISTVHNEFQKSSILMGLADRVIAVSKAVARSMNQRGIPQDKLRVICNGTLGSPRSRQLKNYTPRKLKHPAIATVAGMYVRKGINELIDAFAAIAPNFPEMHLYLIGNGPDRTLFEEQARTTSVADRIHFEGFQSQPQDYLLATDIFVLASHRDPSPLVIPEAREAGCAIVASDVDGIPEALDNGQAGLLVPPKDSQALAQTLSRLLSDSTNLEKWRMRSQHNLDWLSVRRVSEETLAVYRE
jgi:glycosyltransferase involved in cell wall biosynthesis